MRFIWCGEYTITRGIFLHFAHKTALNSKVLLTAFSLQLLRVFFSFPYFRAIKIYVEPLECRVDKQQQQKQQITIANKIKTNFSCFHFVFVFVWNCSVFRTKSFICLLLAYSINKFLFSLRALFSCYYFFFDFFYLLNIILLLPENTYFIARIHFSCLFSQAFY